MVQMIKNVFINLVKRPATLRYPSERRSAIPRYRGEFILTPEECILCKMCEQGCPADAIKIDKETKKYEWYPLRCIGCGYCEERCPKDAIELDWDYIEPTSVQEIKTWTIELTKHKEAVLSLKEYKDQDYAQHIGCTPLHLYDQEKSILEKFSERHEIFAQLGSFIRCPDEMIEKDEEKEENDNKKKK